MKPWLSRLNTAFVAFLMLTIIWNSTDIILRRWLWEQVPSQVSTRQVYGLLLFNVLFIGYLLRRRYKLYNDFPVYKP